MAQETQAPRTPAQLAHQRRIAPLGGLAKAAKYDGRELTEAARRAFRDSFAARVRAEHPDLDDVEVARRADVLRRLHYQRAAYASAAARRKRGRL